MMLAVDWTTREKWYRSVELFARYVVPQFRGSLKGMQNSYDRMVEDNRMGRLPQARSGVVNSPSGQAAGS